MEGIEHADFKSSFDAGHSVLFQGGVYAVYHLPHRFRSKNRLKEYSTRQVISASSGFDRVVEGTVMYSRLEMI